MRIPEIKHDNFSVFWGDEKTADVTFTNSMALIKRYSQHPVKQIFAKDEIPLFEFGEILKTRCWDEHRDNLEKYLHKLGLSDYNPYEICRKTHGVMCQDKVWFKYEGESLTWDDVKWK